jgi:hypothetical protein
MLSLLVAVAVEVIMLVEVVLVDIELAQLQFQDHPQQLFKLVVVEVDLMQHPLVEVMV